MVETSVVAAYWYREHTVEREGVRLNVQDEGPVAAPPVLLLAGLGMSATVWDPFADQLLRAGLRVLRLETRGHGRSDAPRSGYRLADLTSDVIAVLDEFDLPAAHLVGHSLGGTVAVQVALAAPERVTSISLLGALVAGQPPPATFLAWAGEVLRLLNDGLPALLRELPNTSAYRHHLTDPVRAAELHHLVSSTLRAPGFVPENFADAATGGGEVSSWDRLKGGELTVPILTVDGEEDLVTGGLTDTVGTSVPGAQAVTLPRVGHLALLEQPATVAAAWFRQIAREPESAAR